MHCLKVYLPETSKFGSKDVSLQLCILIYLSMFVGKSGRRASMNDSQHLDPKWYVLIEVSERYLHILSDNW